MPVATVLDRLLSREGVHNAHIMDAATMVRMELEESKNKGTGCRYENRALDECRKMECRICVFSDHFLEAPTEMMSVMVDDSGKIFGHDVPYGMPRSRIQDGAVWVGSTYVVYPNAIPSSDLKFVVLPHSLSFLEQLEGVKKVVAFNPSIPANNYLRDRFGYEGPVNATSTVIAVDFEE